MTVHPDLASEQAYIDYAYEQLERMRASAERLREMSLEIGASELRPVSASGDEGLGGILFERDAFMSAGLNRLGQLQVGGHSLVFGRMDSENGDRWYIGRLAVAGPEHEPVVVDWRAPVAEAFYRATAVHALGLKRRRHLLTEGRTLTGIEDELFGDEFEATGSAALLAALQRSRSVQMRDIVATIQSEQDEVIRAPLPGVLVVQGGPGTGKTAVALHRAAYLLFSYRRRLERHVLVLGPNPVFLRYIEQVLPALGESGVALSTISGLVPWIKVTGSDPPETSRIKGDARMAQVIARAVRTRQRPLANDLRLEFDGRVLVVSRRASAGIVRSARSRGGKHNDMRSVVERNVWRLLYKQYSATPDAAPASAGELRRALGRQVTGALNRMWPRLNPEDLLHDLYGSDALVDDAARGLLSEHERRALHRPWSKAHEVDWTAADIALIDEALVHLGPRRRMKGSTDEEDIRDYGHVVVDEVQDLSPMQLRMIRRRSATGSMTIVGDLAQATSYWAPERWGDLLEHLPSAHVPRTSELTVNYRTPAEIMDLAARVLRRAAPALQPPKSVRATGEQPEFVRANVDDAASAVAASVGAERERSAAGTVAVIFPASMHDELAEAMAAASIEAGDAVRDGMLSAVTLVPVEIVKGLEFDAAIVVEPARIVREAPGGLRALYVALTRATQRLVVVHAEPLPAALEA
jgi:DNA helicase IV